MNEVQSVPTVEQQLAAIGEQMEEQVGYWNEGLEETNRMKAFALGAMMGVKLSADRVQPGQTVVRLPSFWQRSCNRLDV